MLVYNIAEVRFELREEIGYEGKNSKVFIAYDPQLKSEIVIKKISKSDIDNIDNYFSESGILYEAFHPNVVQIHYACEDVDCVYIAMPYYKNGSLKKSMSARNLTVREIIVAATQFLNGLNHIHTKNLIHFDIKPDNILISPRGEALLSDFGLAKKTALCGLAEADEFYFKMCPPEAFSKHEFSTHFDIYQSGLTLYRMCVGDIVFYDQYYSYFSNGSFDRDIFKVDVRNSIFPDRDVLPIHIPQKLKATIKKCLHSDINHRFSSAIDVINELAGIEGNILDWECEYSDTDICYTKNVDDKKYELIVTNDKKSTATKQVNGGKKRTIPDYCLGNINNRSVYKFLVSH